jgi:CHAD domain-containing protein
VTHVAVEIERKYEVPPAFAVDAVTPPPGTELGSAVRHELVATYWDTGDLRLARNRVTLRRRTGGNDAGWHVKRPAGVDRDELQLPLGRGGSALPAKVAAEVAAISRGGTLAPVVRLTTVRTEYPVTDGNGRVLAMVADDQVSAEPIGAEATGGDAAATTSRAWRELEVELVDGDRGTLKALDKVLRRVGACPSAAPSKLARALGDRLPAPEPAPRPPAGSAAAVVGAYLAAQRDALVGYDPAVRRDVPDSVHKMRVATRRLRSALRSFRPLLDRDTADAMRAELSWLADELGRVRDAEVLAGRLAAAVDGEPPELVLGPVTTRLTAQLRARVGRHRHALLAALAGERYLTLLDDLDRLVAGVGAAPTARGTRPAGVEVPRLVRKAVRRVDRLMAVADQAPAAVPVATPPLPGTVDRDTALHEVRKAAKRARYAAEAATPVSPKRAGQLAAAMESVQELLGDHHDSVVTRDLLRTAALRAHGAGENAFTYGLLHARQAAFADRLTAALPGTWERATSPRVRRWLG